MGRPSRPTRSYAADDRQRPAFEFERGRDAVKRLHARRRQVLPVRMQVDEPRRHHEPARVEHGAPLERRPRDRGDAAVPNAHRPNAVEPRLRVDDTSVREHEIEGATGSARGRGGVCAVTAEAAISEVRSKQQEALAARCGITLTRKLTLLSVGWITAPTREDITAMANIIESFRGEFLRYRALAEAAIAQLDDADLSIVDSSGSNSIVVICWHIAGNLRSRFTDFLTADGEKPWRHRDEEFEERQVTKEALFQKWNAGWDVLVTTLDALTDEQVHATVTIRGQSMTVHEALSRSLAHLSYHVGQIVYIAKAMRGENFTSLSIPRGASDISGPMGDAR